MLVNVPRCPVHVKFRADPLHIGFGLIACVAVHAGDHGDNVRHGASCGFARSRRRYAMPTATAPASAPAPMTDGTPILAALRPVRKSRISQPRLRATSRSTWSGFTATAVPVSDSMGMSFAASEY